LSVFLEVRGKKEIMREEFEVEVERDIPFKRTEMGYNAILI
jgi:hypothetical protein